MSSLLRIYFVRGLVAIAWSAGFAAVHTLVGGHLGDPAHRVPDH